MTDLDHLPDELTETIKAASSVDPKTLEPEAGHLWVLSWNSSYLGLALIAAVKDGYVLGWPVTLPSEPTFAPALQVQTSITGGTLYLWPTREIGLGIHLLDRPLTPILTPKLIQRLAWAMDDGQDPGFPFASGSASDTANRSADDAMLEKWADLCFHTWPSQRNRYLASTKVQALGKDSKWASDCLGLKPAELRPVWTGVQPLTDDQIAVLTSDLRVQADEILGDDPLQAAIDRLAHPRFKSILARAASQSGITEGQARSEAREQFALAARNDSTSSRDQKLLDAIKRVAAAHQPKG